MSSSDDEKYKADKKARKKQARREAKLLEEEQRQEKQARREAKALEKEKVRQREKAAIAVKKSTKKAAKKARKEAQALKDSELREAKSLKEFTKKLSESMKKDEDEDEGEDEGEEDEGEDDKYFEIMERMTLQRAEKEKRLAEEKRKQDNERKQADERMALRRIEKEKRKMAEEKRKADLDIYKKERRRETNKRYYENRKAQERWEKEYKEQQLREEKAARLQLQKKTERLQRDLMLLQEKTGRQEKSLPVITPLDYSRSDSSSGLSESSGFYNTKMIDGGAGLLGKSNSNLSSSTTPPPPYPKVGSIFNEDTDLQRVGNIVNEVEILSGGVNDSLMGGQDLVDNNYVEEHKNEGISGHLDSGFTRGQNAHRIEEVSLDDLDSTVPSREVAETTTPEIGGIVDSIKNLTLLSEDNGNASWFNTDNELQQNINMDDRLTNINRVVLNKDTEIGKYNPTINASPDMKLLMSQGVSLGTITEMRNREIQYTQPDRKFKGNAVNLIRMGNRTNYLLQHEYDP